MTPRKIRILNSPTLFFALILTELIAIGMIVCFTAFEPVRRGAMEKIPVLYIGLLTYLAFALIYLFFGCAPKFFSIISIDETGVSRAFLGKFCKLHISWDEMAEAYSFIAVVRFVTFSKYKKVSTMSNWKMRREKNAIEMTLSKKRYAVIAQYLKQPIVGLPYSVKKWLTGEKK